MSRRCGLSQFEVLLACLILAMVLCLTVLGIVRVRDTADRARCANNLKQIELAVLNFSYGNRGKLPCLVDQGKNASTGTGLPSLFFNVLPYLEQDIVYGIYRRRSGPSDYYAHSSVLVYSRPAGNGSEKDPSPVSFFGGTGNQLQRIYVDPSDQSGGDGLRDVPVSRPDGVTGYYTTGSYAANGLVFGSNDARLPQTFVDGCSNTVAFAERPQVCHTATGETVYNLWGLGFYSPHMPAFATLTPDEPAGLNSTGEVAPVTPLPPRESPSEIQVRIGRESAPPQRPDFATPVQILRGSSSCDPRIPGSPHFGVMQTAMADGSVHVFARTVSPWLFWGACTPNGGEDLRADW